MGTFRKGFAFFMEQGLGKSLTTLENFDRLVRERLATRLVVVGPNSFKGGWADEIGKHHYHFDPHIFESGSSLNDAFLRKDFDRPPVLIINYEAVRSEATQEYIKRFIAGRNAMIAADESIKLKTHNSDQTKSMLALSPLFEYQRILSGKPTTQGPHDLWAQMRFIRQLNGKNYYAFRNAFCRMGGFRMKKVLGVQNEEILHELINEHIFRATKKDWTDLPPKVYLQREYKMTPEMKSMYRQMQDEFVLMLDDETISVNAAITKYIKLAQIQCGFIHNEEGRVRVLVEPGKNPRLNALKETIEDEVTGKFSVVYHHKYSLTLLQEALAAYRPVAITGGMLPGDIDEVKRVFNNDPRCRVILLQDDASKYGHTLLAGPAPEDKCYTQLFFENSYNLDTRAQIEDRHHRHGQTSDSVNYIDLVGSPLDKAVTRALADKENIFQTVFKHIRSIPSV